eukprot:4187230-Prymnesium_polylepis.1
MRAAADERAAAAVEMHGLAPADLPFGDGDVRAAGSGGCSTSRAGCRRAVQGARATSWPRRRSRATCCTRTRDEGAA